MEKSLALEWMHDMWMMRNENLEQYASIAHDVLLGKEIPTGLFGSLTLPDVPKNMALVVMAGPLTKSDVCAWKGSRTISNEISAAAKDSSIDAIILLSENCPGGQVDGTQSLSDAVIAAKEKKPVIGVISGMACSAAMWALSNCDAIYATSETDMVGCIGTMAKLRNPKTAKDGDYIEILSDLSPDKNSEFKDPEKLKSSYLNPVTESFHNAVKNGRGDKLKLDKENVLSGKTYVANHAHEHGLIDGVMPFNSVVKQTKKSIRTNSKNSNSNMKFPKLAALLGFKSEEATSEIVLDESGATLEALVAERDALVTEKNNLTETVTSLNAKVAERDETIATLTSGKSTLESENADLQTKNENLTTSNSTLTDKVSELEKLTAGNFSEATSDSDKETASDKNENEFLTSYDVEFQRMREQAKIKE